MSAASCFDLRTVASIVGLTWRAVACADYLRIVGGEETVDLDGEYRDLLEAYDRGGLPFERALTRLSYAAWLRKNDILDQAERVANSALALARQYAMPIVEMDAQGLLRACAANADPKIVRP